MFAGLSLGFLFACSGGGDKNTPPAPPSKATGLGYTDPASGDFRLVKDSASNGSKIVLDLVGPATGQGRGVSFTFTVDATKASLVKVVDVDPEYVQNGSVFSLGNAPQVLKGIKQDGTLHVTVSQKGAGNPRGLGGVLVRIAVQFKQEAGLTVGTTIPISVTEGQYLPASGTAQTMNVNCGVLTAQ